MKLACDSLLHLLTKHFVVGLDKILQQSKQSLAKFQILSLCPIYLALESRYAKSLPTLCNPIDGSPPGSPVPGILQARTLEWVAISFSNA